MRRRSRLVRQVVAILGLLAVAPSSGRGEEPRVVSLSERIGPEIDARERDEYRLFPDLESFDHARILESPSGRFVLEYTARDARRRRPLSADALDLTRRHVARVEELRRLEAAGADPSLEARILYRMALRFTLETRYDDAIRLTDELVAGFPADARDLDAAGLAADARALRDDRRALTHPGAVTTREGRTDALVFAGYYGTWLAVAVPAAADAESAEPYALSLLTIPAASLALAHYATRNAHFTDEDAVLLSLGGHLGTWQGLGWASRGETGGRDVLTAGILAGLGGVAVGALAAKHTDLSGGHAALMDAALPWGAWLGWVAWQATQREGAVDDSDDALAAALVGSGAAVGLATILGRGTSLDRRRVRLANLGGVLGALAGGAIVLLAEPDDQASAVMLGTSSIVGALAALQLSGETSAP